MLKWLFPEIYNNHFKVCCPLFSDKYNPIENAITKEKSSSLVEVILLDFFFYSTIHEQQQRMSLENNNIVSCNKKKRMQEKIILLKNFCIYRTSTGWKM